MIRRNHNECSVKTNRNSRPRPSFDQSNFPSSQYRPQSQLRYEDIRLTSSNKKYHQYKDWKQNNANDVKEFNDHLKINGDPLLQLKKNETNPRQKSKLKRQYDYQLDENLRVNYDSIKIDRTNVGNKEDLRQKQVENGTIERYDYSEKSERVEPRTIRDIASHSISIDNTFAQSPKNKDQSYKSIRKYREYEPYAPKMLNSTPQPFTQLFAQTSFQVERKYIPDRKPANRDQIFKTDNYLVKEIRQAHHKNPYQQKVLSYNHIPIKLTANQFKTSNQGNIQSAKANAQPRAKQQVQEKLKMISQFNDKINERIKSIIVCFQGLKSKL